jgi:hypothetical protein
MTVQTTSPAAARCCRAQDSEPELCGFRFISATLPDAAGVYALTRRIGDLVYSVGRAPRGG